MTGGLNNQVKLIIFPQALRSCNFVHEMLYRISSNKRPGAYFKKFWPKGRALIGRRALNRGGRLLSFSFKEQSLFWLNLENNKIIIITTTKKNHYIIHLNVTSTLTFFVR